MNFVLDSEKQACEGSFMLPVRVCGVRRQRGTGLSIWFVLRHLAHEPVYQVDRLMIE
jgi:hypothetical protein